MSRFKSALQAAARGGDEWRKQNVLGEEKDFSPEIKSSASRLQAEAKAASPTSSRFLSPSAASHPSETAMITPPTTPRAKPDHVPSLSSTTTTAMNWKYFEECLLLKSLSWWERLVAVLFLLVACTFSFSHLMVIEDTAKNLIQNASNQLLEFLEEVSPWHLAMIVSGTILMTAVFDRHPTETDKIINNIAIKLSEKYKPVLSHIYAFVERANHPLLRQVLVLTLAVALLRYTFTQLSSLVNTNKNSLIIVGKWSLTAAFVVLLVAGLFFYQRWQAARKRQRRIAVLALKAAIIDYLERINSVAIAYLRRELLDQEERVRHGLPALSTDSMMLLPAAAGFISPAASKGGGGVTGDVTRVILPSLPKGLSVQGVWKELQQEMARDERVQTITQIKHGKPEECWRYKAALVATAIPTVSSSIASLI